jgi:UPF0176 protein
VGQEFESLQARHFLYNKAMIKVAALYKFSQIADPQALSIDIKTFLSTNNIYGTILVGEEGLNGTISGKENNIDNVIIFLKKIAGFEDLDVKYSYSDINPFVRLKIKLKKEIVTIGDPSVNPNINSGTYVDPKDWNDLISDKDVLLVDTRNDYEVSIGSFKNAVNPKTNTFREFPKWVSDLDVSEEKKKSMKVAMYCTGGIRCEKASAYMKSSGFENVYHLKGGILKYFEEIDNSRSLWNGECFVFDDRVAVKHDLSEGSYDMCHGCRMPITDDDKQSYEYERGVSCPNCFHVKTDEQKSRYKSRQKQVDLAKSRNQKHIGQRQKAT